MGRRINDSLGLTVKEALPPGLILAPENNYKDQMLLSSKDDDENKIKPMGTNHIVLRTTVMTSTISWSHLVLSSAFQYNTVIDSVSLESGGPGFESQLHFYLGNVQETC